MFDKRLLLFLIITITRTVCDDVIKLIVHMDVNKTIIAQDLGNNKQLDDVLIECIAKECTGRWSPVLSADMTYVQYVKDYLAPGEKSDRQVRSKRNELIHAFFDFLKEIGDDRRDALQNKRAQLKRKIEAQPGIIFQSFFNLIIYLENANINYSIILRSFGQELGTVTQEMVDRAGIRFEWKGRFIAGALHLTSHTTGERIVLNSLQEMYAFFKTHKNIYIRDDFKLWNDNHEQAEFGKLFPVDLADTAVKTIFFDDNADESIINPRAVSSGEFMCSNDLGGSAAVYLVDTLQAIENDHYFIECLSTIGM